MRREESWSGEVEKTVRVSFQEAQAVERCLKVESGALARSVERLRVIHFGRRLPTAVNVLRASEHHLQVRLVERSTSPDEVELEVVRVLSDEVRRSSLLLPRNTLRAALRKSARAELLGGVPADFMPILGVECTRRSWRHSSGWRLSIDRDLALHRIDPDMLERSGRLALGLPDRCVDAQAVLTLEAGDLPIPGWLEHVLHGAERWSPLTEGLALVAHRPAQRPQRSELRLVQL